ncbi:MAG TPA: hypothetical protein VFZ58_00240 [Candidatus Saccharimonadales bacterium]
MIMKKTILAVILNVLFGGVGYIYIKEPTRIPLAIFLIFVTVYEFIRNIFVISNPATANDPFAIHMLPMLSLFGSIAGTILLIIMAVDVYLLVKRQYSKPGRSRSRSAKAA